MSTTKHSEQDASSTRKTAKEARTKKAKGASKSESAHKLTAKQTKSVSKCEASLVAPHKSTAKTAAKEKGYSL